VFTDFKEKFHFEAPLLEYVMKKLFTKKNFKVSLRRRLAAKTRLATQISEKIKLILQDFWNES
jgi:hypothetical protein